VDDKYPELGRLKKVLSKPDTILLIGSGVSVWSGLPSWRTLIEKLADFVDSLGFSSGSVRQELSNNDLLLAASYAASQIKPAELGKFLRSACLHGNSEPHEIHSLICQLGPTSFITTNYDQLLEDAIKKNPQAKRPRVITSRQPTEIPELQQSSSCDFVFKYHGDIEDSDSIILTREQYGRFHGSFAYVKKAIEIILMSRPVVMIGFGIRDPDFLAIQDVLKSIYPSGFGEMFAIMPDMDEVAATYWRENYSIEIAGYKTVQNPDGTRGHGDLLELLRLLKAKSGDVMCSPITTAEVLIRLGRHANMLSQILPEEEPLPLTVERKENRPRFLANDRMSLDGVLKTESDLMLLGKPGAGKSYGLKRLVAQEAAKLMKQCLANDAAELLQNGHLLPVLYANLAEYDGDLLAQLNATLPEGLNLSELLNNHRSTVVLDGANEMPEVFIERGEFANDLVSFRGQFKRGRIVIGGREGAWQNSIEMSQYQIQSIDPEYIVSQFKKRHGIDLHSNYSLMATLSTPLYFRSVLDSPMDFNAEIVPADIHRQAILSMQELLLVTLGRAVSLSTLLSRIAYSMMFTGTEYFDVDSVRAEMLSLGFRSKDSDALLNTLIGNGFFIPHTNLRISFFHQSMTEYLASSELAKRFENDPQQFVRCLKHRRWDHSLYLALDQLSEAQRHQAFRVILANDMIAAGYALKHIKEDRSSLVDFFLNALVERSGELSFNDEYSLVWIIEELEVKAISVGALENLSELPNALGGVAAGILISLERHRLPQFLHKLARGEADFNYTNCMVEVIQSFVTVDDIATLLELIPDDISVDENSILPISNAIAKLPPDELIALVRSNMHRGPGVVEIMSDILRNVSSVEVPPILLEFIRRGSPSAAADLYLYLQFRTNLSEERIPNIEYADVLVGASNACEEMDWAGRCLVLLAEISQHWMDHLSKLGNAVDAGVKLALRVERCRANNENMDELASEFISELREMSDRQMQIAMSNRKVWCNLSKEATAEMISFRRASVLECLTDPFEGLKFDLAEFETEEWWLDWILEEADAGSAMAYNTAREFAESTDFKAEVLGRLRDGQQSQLPFILKTIAPAVGITTDDLPAEIVAKLCSDEYLLSVHNIPAIANLATDAFSEEILVDLWENCEDPAKKNRLGIVLSVAGERHNRRYLAR
jgi:hypothetical protein